MFQAGNLVRLITEDGDGEVMRVLVNSEPDGTTYCSTGNDDGATYADTHDLELVTDDQMTFGETQPPVPNVPTRTEEEIHEDIRKMFVQIAQWLQAQGIEEQINLSIDSDCCAGATGLDIKFAIRIGYNENVVTRNLFKSAQFAMERAIQDKAYAPISIPMYKDTAE